MQPGSFVRGVIRRRPLIARRRRRKFWAEKRNLAEIPHQTCSATRFAPMGKSWFVRARRPRLSASSCYRHCLCCYCRVPAALLACCMLARTPSNCSLELADACMTCAPSVLRFAQRDLRFAQRDLRVSAAARRGAAAYGDASQRLAEARTHGCLVNLR